MAGAETSGPGTLVVTTPTPQPTSFNLFNLPRVPEDQVGASKEVMIQVGLMNKSLKQAYDASEALRTNVRVSVIVSVFFIQKIFEFCDSTRSWHGVVTPPT